MIIQRMYNNPHSFRVLDGTVFQKSMAHPIEVAVLEQIETELGPGDIGDFEIIVRRKIREVDA